jgi:hypothetical protein
MNNINGWTKDILQHSKKELELIGLANLPVGESILNFIKESSEACHQNTFLINKMINGLYKLVNQEVLSEITEIDFDGPISEDNVIKCTRYEHVVKDLTDGNYYDMHGIVYLSKDDDMRTKVYMYNDLYNSKVKITLPYLPSQQIRYFENNYINIV